MPMPMPRCVWSLNSLLMPLLSSSAAAATAAIGRSEYCCNAGSQIQTQNGALQTRSAALPLLLCHCPQLQRSAHSMRCVPCTLSGALLAAHAPLPPTSTVQLRTRHADQRAAQCAQPRAPAAASVHASAAWSAGAARAARAARAAGAGARCLKRALSCTAPPPCRPHAAQRAPC